MKRAEFMKRCLFGLTVAALVLLGALPASALCVNYYFTDTGTLVVDQGGAFYDSVTGEAVCLPLQNNGHTKTRPLSDFLSTQGTFCFPDGAGGCRIFNPGIPNFLFWTDDARGRRAVVDYAGLVAGFGTVVTGTVTETKQKDGRALVRVGLDTMNAFSWVVAGFSTSTSPVILGNRIDAVQAGAEPALGNSSFRVEFFNSGMGAPLPDLVQVVAFPQNGQPIALRNLTFTADIFGEIHETFGVAEGTPGEATITMLNLQMNGPGPTIPVENIIVNVAQ